MSSKLSRGGRESKNEFDKFRTRNLFRQLRQRRRYPFVGPWQGYTPDVPHSRADFSFFEDMMHLVVKPGAASQGEVLTNDAGFIQADSARLPLGNDANTTNDICAIAQFNMTDATGVQNGEESTMLLVVTAGDGSNAGSQQLWQITANTAQWVEIPGSGDAGTVEMKAAIGGDTTALHRKSMVDWCVFPLGAAARSANSGNIDTPAFVFTNNVDPVMVYPAAETNVTDYEELTDQSGLDEFICISVETYNDRVYFLNTSENGTRVPNRIRRTARGTCDPLTTTAGAGSFRIEELSTGLRLLTLGDFLVAYFDDGVAFVRDTFNSAAPNAVQVLDERRGLLSTHGVVNVPGVGHFGIYNDGWWMLDQNGRFRQLGFLQDGSEKWKRRFYANFDFDNAHRLHCTYEARRNFVRCVVPVTTGGTELWTYDVTNDRVFLDDYSTEATCFGVSIVNTDTAEAWSDQVDGVDTWSAIDGSWDSFASEQGGQFLLHGNTAGYVFLHKDDIITQDGEAPNWSFKTVEWDFNNITSMKRADRMSIQHINSDNTNPVSVTVSGPRGGSATNSSNLSDGTGGPHSVEVAQTDFHSVSGETLKFSVSGSGPIQIRAFEVLTVERGSERAED